MSATAVPIRPIKRGSVLRLWVGLILLSVAAAALAWRGTSSLQYHTTESGLQYRVIKEGEGPHPTTADIALIDYTGKLDDGTVFDSTKGKQPVPMPVSGNIPGFSEGLQLMRKGSVYRFRMPPQLAYGSQGAGGVIPPNATLTFDVSLHQFMNMAQLQGMMGGMQNAQPPPQ
jgi:FKBP-type peptidyl-prolyl cis-trans isomerase